MSDKERAYHCWEQMRQRCRNVRHHKYPRYGARGITICPRWDEFANFVADMGYPPLGLSLDRVDNDGNYEPGNCRWATPKQQQANTSFAKSIEIDGEVICLSEAARRYGLKGGALWYRMKRWPREEWFVPAGSRR